MLEVDKVKVHVVQMLGRRLAKIRELLALHIKPKLQMIPVRHTSMKITFHVANTLLYPFNEGVDFCGKT